MKRRGTPIMSNMSMFRMKGVGPMRVVCGLCAAVAVLFGGVAQAAESKNIVVNGDFRDGAKGWSVPKKGWKVVAGDGMNPGEGALVWENSDPDFYEFPVQRFAATPGVAYRFRALVRVDSLEGNVLDTGLGMRSKSGEWLGGAHGRPVYDNDVSVEVELPPLGVMVFSMTK